MAQQPAPPWWPFPAGIGWLFAIVVLVLAILLLVHVLPVDALTVGACLALLAVARLVP
jgi:hypothetical protein